MADLNYDVSVNTTAAVRNLENLNGKVKGLSTTFNAFQRIVTGISLTAFIRSSLQFADSVDDVSNSTGIATEKVLGFGRAVSANGGTFEGATSALTKFSLSIQEAADGGAKSQQAFERVGISLKDLATLSEQQLFDKTIKGLAAIKDKSEAAAVANELVGKTIRGTDFAKLGEDYAKAARESAKYNDAIKAGAQTQDEIGKALTTLKLVVLENIKPLAELAKSINENAKTIGKWIAVIFEVVKVLATFFIIGRVIKWILALGEAIYGIFKGFGELTKASKVLTGMMEYTGKSFREVIKLAKELGASNLFARKVLEALSKVYTALGNALGALGAGILAVLGLDKAYQKWKDTLSESALTLEETVDYIDELNEKSTEAWLAQQEQAKAIREVEDANRKLNASIREVAKSYEKNREATEAALESEVAFAMMSSDTADQIRAQQQAYNDIINAVDELKKRKEELGKGNEKQIALINSEIAALMAQIPAATESARARVEALQTVRNEQEKLRLETERAKQGLANEQSLNQLRDQIELIGLYGDELENAQIILKVSQELESKLLDLRNQELDLLSKKGQLTEEQFNIEYDNIQKLRTAASEYANTRLELETQVVEKQRELTQDWQKELGKQLSDLADSITPAKMAADLFGSAINTIDQTLTDFVQKGKFSFKDFATSILKDIGLIIARALVMRAILALVGMVSPTAATSLGNILKGGMAKGGSVGPGSAYMVGEKGPELFVPRSAGTIIPNNMLGAAPSQTQVTYNINAVDASSFRNLVARDPQFIFNVTEVGRRSSPSRRLA